MKRRDSKENAKNICQYCGGPLVIEFIGSYGSVYPMKENGEPGRRRIKRILYEEGTSDCMIYCRNCKKMQE